MAGREGGREGMNDDRGGRGSREVWVRGRVGGLEIRVRTLR